jgi:hypothetical protein
MLVKVALLQRKCLIDWHRYAGGGDMSFVGEVGEEARTAATAAAAGGDKPGPGVTAIEAISKLVVAVQGAAAATTVKEVVGESAGAGRVQGSATAGGAAGEGALETVVKEPTARQAVGEDVAGEDVGRASAGGPARPVQGAATAGGAADGESPARIAATHASISEQLEAAWNVTQELVDLLAAQMGDATSPAARMSQESESVRFSAVAAALSASHDALAAVRRSCGIDATESSHTGSRETLPRRLSGLPLQGLPVPVVDQLQSFDAAWPAQELSIWMHEEVGLKYYQGLGKEQQQALVRDLLQLGAVFLAEVPVSVGCSNPGCVSLAGASEVAVSNKACTGCKVVYYCSRRCQVEHWKVHKKMCQQLKQQQAGAACSIGAV